jgi:hypothetical protein
MKFKAIHICPKKDSGLCNQIYSLITGICYCIENKVNILFIKKFYKSINTENYCNISEIIDIDYLNLYLSKYSIFLVDSNNFKFNINNAFIIDANNNIIFDVTNNIIETYLSDSEFNIPKYSKLLPETNLNYGFDLLIKYQLNNGFFEERYPIVDNKLIESVNYNFTDLRYDEYSVSGAKHKYFWEILQNIKFLDIFINKANDIKRQICSDNSQKINCIHLKLENDCIDHYKNIYNMDKNIIKQTLENMYIEMITNNILETELNIVLTCDLNNNVIKFLQNNNYKFITTPKLFEDRELNAIIDLEIGLLCNHKYIFTFESSFSFTLLKKLSLKNTNIGNHMIVFEEGLHSALMSKS